MSQSTSDMFVRIDRPNRLPNEVVRSLLSAIDSGRLKPGDKIPTEHVLSKQFGVARTVVREAISLLKHDRVIVSKQGVGAFVSDPGKRSAFRIGAACFEKRKQLLELLELRTGAQAEASALAARKRTAEDLEDIEKSLKAMSESLSLGADGAEPRADAELTFYRAITAASGNSQYIEFIGMIENRLMENLRSVMVKNARAAEWGDAVLSEHGAVFAALRDGDAEAARDATRAHFERAARRLADRADFADVE